MPVCDGREREVSRWIAIWHSGLFALRIEIPHAFDASKWAPSIDLASLRQVALTLLLNAFKVAAREAVLNGQKSSNPRLRSQQLGAGSDPLSLTPQTFLRGEIKPDWLRLAT